MSQANEKWKSLFFRDASETDEVNMDRLKNQGCGNPFGGKPHVWPKYSSQTFTIYKSNFAAIDTASDEDSIMPDSYQDFKTSLNSRATVRLLRKHLNNYLVTHPQIPTLGKVLLVPSPSMTFDQVKNADLHYWKQRNDKVSKITQSVHKPKSDGLSRETSLDRSVSRDNFHSMDQMQIDSEFATDAYLMEEKENQYFVKHKKQKLDLSYTSIRTRLMRLLNRKGKMKLLKPRFQTRRNFERNQAYNLHLYINSARKTETIIRIKRQSPQL